MKTCDTSILFVSLYTKGVGQNTKITQICLHSNYCMRKKLQTTEILLTYWGIKNFCKLILLYIKTGFITNKLRFVLTTRET